MFAIKSSDVHLERILKSAGSGWRPWHFISEDGRLDLTMIPFYDNITNMMPLNLVGMTTHQVHGFCGTEM